MQLELHNGQTLAAYAIVATIDGIYLEAVAKGGVLVFDAVIPMHQLHAMLKDVSSCGEVRRIYPAITRPTVSPDLLSDTLATIPPEAGDMHAACDMSDDHTPTLPFSRTRNRRL